MAIGFWTGSPPACTSTFVKGTKVITVRLLGVAYKTFLKSFLNYQETALKKNQQMFKFISSLNHETFQVLAIVGEQFTGFLQS